MFLLSRDRLFAGLAAIICVGIVLWFVLEHLIPSPPHKIVVATGVKNQIYQSIGIKYREILQHSGVDLEERLTKGAVENIQLLNDAASGIDVGFVQGGISDGSHSPELLSLGRVNYQFYWIFYRGAGTLGHLRELKGKRVAVGPPGSGQRAMTDKIFGISGITSENTTLLGLTAQEAGNAISEGKIDALFLPFALESPVLLSLLKNPKIRLISLTEADALTRIFPFLVRLILPPAVIDFEKIIPAHETILLATTNAVLVRKDIHPALIDLLAQAILDVHGKPGLFQQAGEFPKLNDPEYPVAQIASEYYKNGPAFLNKYLPFWMTNYVKKILAVIATVIAVILPLFNYMPKLYHWLVREYVDNLMRRLRVIETGTQTELGIDQVQAAQKDLESVSWAAHLLPMRHTDLFFSLRGHIDRVRTRIASKLVEAQGKPA